MYLIKETYFFETSYETDIYVIQGGANSSLSGVSPIKKKTVRMS